jgi:hypothetical protein
MNKRIEYIGKIRKEGGHTDEIPIEIKKRIYDVIMSIDLDEDDKMRSMERYRMHQLDEAPGIGVIVYDDKFVAIMKMGVYDPESESVVDEKVIACGIPRDDVKKFLEE